MTAVIKGVKLVREDNKLLQDSGAIAIQQEEEMYEYLKAPGVRYKVNQEECVEVLKFGISPDVGTDSIRFTDREKQQWNQFFTIAGEGLNTLPFNMKRSMEETMMEWGYSTYLANVRPGVDYLAPTWKLSEGDEIYCLQKAGIAPVATGSKAVLVTRRYMKGSSVDFKHFHTIDGGLGNPKRFYNNDQLLGTTVTGLLTDAWTYDLVKNEAFKYFFLGIEPGTTSKLVSATVKIDDPEKEYNTYFVNKTYNQLPYVDKVDIVELAVATTYHAISELPQLQPTLDVVKGTNKSLKVKALDDGTGPATGIHTRFMGVRYLS